MVKEAALSGKIDSWAGTQTALVKESALNGKIDSWASTQSTFASKSAFDDLSDEVGGMKTTIGNENSGLVKNVKDAGDKADAATAAVSGKLDANANAVANLGFPTTTVLNTTLYGSGSNCGNSAKPCDGTLGYNAGLARTAVQTSDFDDKADAWLEDATIPITGGGDPISLADVVVGMANVMIGNGTCNNCSSGQACWVFCSAVPHTTMEVGRGD